MKNALGKKEDLNLYNKEGKLIYKYGKDSDGFSCKGTYDSNGNPLTYEDSNGYSWKATYDENGNRLTYENSDGFSCKRTYDKNGNQLTYENSDGFSSKNTYDSNGNELTHQNSDGFKRGFDIPELTMEELVKKIGNFKLVK
tara:strand:+ start:40 stop:462 length:423 start_codon:yes stop_codon:yes gene_type:complete